MRVEDFVALVSTTPARLNGLRGKGYIAPGSDADLVVFDPYATRTVTTADLHMATDYTPYEGHTLTGWPQVVISNGRIVVDRDGFHDPGPVGRPLRSRALLDGHLHVPVAPAMHGAAFPARHNQFGVALTSRRNHR
jgi:dihydropyrimidinase